MVGWASLRLRPRHLALLLLAAGGVLLVLSISAEANHFRGGTIYAVPDPSDPLKVRLHGTLYFRTTWVGWQVNGALACSPAAPTVPLPLTSINGCILGRIFYGDEVSCSDPTYCPGDINYRGRVDYFSADDFFSVILVGPDGKDGIPHSYGTANDANGNPWLASYVGQARFADTFWCYQVCSPPGSTTDVHVNNVNTVYFLETSVQLSPVPNKPVNLFSTGSLLPIYYCAKNSICTIPVQAQDADKDAKPYTVRLAQADSSGRCEATAGYGECNTGLFCQPGESLCPTGGNGGNALPMKAVGQTLVWDTTGAYLAPDFSGTGLLTLANVPRTLYSASVMIVEESGGQTPVEFLIALGEPRVPTPPSADFYWDPVRCGPQYVTFHDASTPSSSGPLASADWDWGDGSVQNYPTWQSTVTHYYAAPGSFQVILTVYDSQGASSTKGPKELVIVACKPPVAYFEIDNYPCAVPRTLTFHDMSTPEVGHPIVKSEWNWGDGTPTASYTPAPATLTHTFTGTGAVTVKMRVQDNTTAWSQWYGRHLRQCPIPSFTSAMDPNGCPDYVVKFADGSSDPDGEIRTYAWDFGDGTGSNDRLPTHAYQLTGTYKVGLTVMDNDLDSATFRTDVKAHGYEDCDVDKSNAGAKAPADGSPKDARDRAVSAEDVDKDGVPARMDNCESIANTNQVDTDGDGKGDACDGDKDGDGLPNSQDVCSLVPDPAQLDSNHDGRGDACQDDADGDGVLDINDDCIVVADPIQADKDKDGLGDLCDSDIDGDGVANAQDAFPLDGARALGGPAQERSRPSALAAVSAVVPAGTGLWLSGSLLAAALLGVLLFVVVRKRSG